MRTGPGALLVVMVVAAASPAWAGGEARPVGRDAALVEDLDRLLDDPALARATLATLVVDADTGRVVYERSAQTLVLPASTAKWITAAAAADRLGLDHRFETTLVADASVADGALEGDLWVVGGGDPALSAADVRGWAAALRAEHGLEAITGRVRVDTSLFADPPYGAGWAWDDLDYGFSAPVSALNVERNLTQVTVRAPTEAGTAPQVDAGALAACVEVRTTAAPEVDDEPPSMVWDRRLQVDEVWARGAETPGAGRVSRRWPVADPGACVAALLTEALRTEGVGVGEGGSLGEVGAMPARGPRGEPLAPVDALLAGDPSRVVLTTHASPPLRELLAVMLKQSQNVYAEAIARSLDPVPVGKTFSGARDVLEGVLRRAGVPEGSYKLADGSGLSRYNLVTAEALARLTRAVARRPWGDALLEMLPIAGVDGTMAWRLVGGPGEGHIQAKTGSMSGVRNLVGVVHRGGPPLGSEDSDAAPSRTWVVVLLCTGFVQPQSAALYLQDAVLQVLAEEREEALPQRRRRGRPRR